MQKWLLFWLLLLVVGIAGCSLAEDITPPPGFESVQPQAEFPPAPPSLENGAQIYAANCTRCHGPQGLGDGEFAAQFDVNAANLTLPDVAQNRSLRDHYLIITNGNIANLMPPWRDTLTEQERWDVAAYVLTFAFDPQTAEIGAENYANDCADCHGLNGQSPIGLSDLSNPQTLSNLSGGALLNAMAAAHSADELAGLSDADLARATQFSRTLAFQGYPLLAQAPPEVETTPEPEITAEPAPSEVGETSLSGLVLNGTTGAVVANQPVQVRVFDQFVETGSFTALTDSEGNFSISGIEPAPERVLFVTSEYAGVSYNSPPRTFEQADPAPAFDLTLYERTESDEFLRISQVVFLVESVADNSAEVVVLVSITNSGNTTVFSTSGGSVRLPLPNGAANIAFEQDSGQRYLVSASTPAVLSLDEPIPPGESVRQMLFSFRLPFTGRLNLNFPVSYPTNQVSVFVPTGIATVTGPKVISQGVQTLQGEPYDGYEMVSPPVGQDLQIQVTPVGGNLLSDSNLQALLVGGGVLLISIALAGFWLTRARGKAVEPAVTESQPQPDRLENPRTERDALLDQLAELDAQHANGGISEQDYQRQRRQLKQALIHLLQTYEIGLDD